MIRRARFVALALAATVAVMACEPIPPIDPPGTTIPGTTTTSTSSTTTTLSPAPTWPTPDTTGVPAGVQLTGYTGPGTIVADGTVIDGKLIPDCLVVRADNVTIRRSKITAEGCPWALNVEGSAQRLLVEDVEVTSGRQVSDRAIYMAGSGTIRRGYVHGTQRGVAVIGSNITIEDSWIGGNSNDTPAHASAVGAWGDTDAVTLRHNVLRTELNTTASSSISVYPEQGPNTRWTIVDNVLSSGGGYVVYLGHTPPEQPNTNMTFTGNRFRTDNYPRGGQYGPVASWSPVPSNVWSGNVWMGGPHDGGGVGP